MNKVKMNLPLLIYIGKIFLDKIGRKGLRVNGSLVHTDDGWQHHLHVSSYREPCGCFQCQPVMKGLTG